MFLLLWVAFATLRVLALVVLAQGESTGKMTYSFLPLVFCLWPEVAIHTRTSQPIWQYVVQLSPLLILGSGLLAAGITGLRFAVLRTMSKPLDE